MHPAIAALEALPPLPRETWAWLGEASTATLTTQLFKRGLRGMHLVGVRPVSRRRRMSGVALTLRYIPSREDLDTLDVFQSPEHPQRRAIELTGPGHVLVMDARGETRAASAGHILVTRLLRRGAAGLVTDGALRDSPAIAETDFPVYAAGSSPTLNLAQHHAVDIGVPIGCGGVPVFPGDVVAGDEEAVVVLPRTSRPRSRGMRQSRSVWKPSSSTRWTAAPRFPAPIRRVRRLKRSTASGESDAVEAALIPEPASAHPGPRGVAPLGPEPTGALRAYRLGGGQVRRLPRYLAAAVSQVPLAATGP